MTIENVESIAKRGLPLKVHEASWHFYFFCLPFSSSPDKVAGSAIIFDYNLLLQIFLTYFDQVR